MVQSHFKTVCILISEEKEESHKKQLSDKQHGCSNVHNRHDRPEMRYRGEGRGMKRKGMAMREEDDDEGGG